jgi:CelD/BcsL family acetyltransferase involved in cellulose biosynthesis
MKVILYDARDIPSEVVGAWRALMQCHQALDNPLLSPTWIQQIAAAKNGAEVGVVVQDDRPTACLTFERRNGQGFPPGGTLSDLHGFVAPPALQMDAAEVVRQCGLTALHYDHLPAEQQWFSRYHARLEAAPLIVMQDGFDEYWRQRRAASPDRIRQIERKSRKIMREVGPLRFVWQDTDASSLDSLISWKRRQLRASGFIDIFARKWMRPLLEQLIASQAAECQGVLSTLLAGDKLVAVHLGICNRHTMVSSIPTFDQACSSYSPGAVLHMELAKAAAERGIRTIDLGCGGNSLKYALGSTTRELAVGTIDLQPARRWCRIWWHRLRGMMHSSSLGRLPIRAYRQIRRLAGDGDPSR